MADLYNDEERVEPGFSIGLSFSYLVSLVIGIIEAILGLRVILRLFGANPGTGFVQWVYDTSASLMEPFAGIFPTATVTPGFAIDFSAIFAMIVYAVIGYLLKLLFDYVTDALSHGTHGHTGRHIHTH